MDTHELVTSNDSSVHCTNKKEAIDKVKQMPIVSSPTGVYHKQKFHWSRRYSRNWGLELKFFNNITVVPDVNDEDQSADKPLPAKINELVALLKKSLNLK